MMYFSKLKTTIILGVCLIGIVFSVPNFLKQEQLAKMPSWLTPVNLGLDLQGGSHLLLEVDFKTVMQERLSAVEDSLRTLLREEKIKYKNLSTFAKADKKFVSIEIPNTSQRDKALPIMKKADEGLEISQEKGGKFKIEYTEQAIKKLRLNVVEQSIEIVRKRIDELGTKEPTIQRQGNNRIVVQLPGEDNPERVKALIGKTAKLTFHMVDEKTSLANAERGKMPLTSKKVPAQNGGYQIVKRRVIVSGEHLTDARPGFDENGSASVNFRFDTKGARDFAKVTRENVGGRLAILLDNKVLTAPTINSAITGGSGQITGGFSAQEAKDLSMMLRAGALPAPLIVMEERTVGPGLGADSIKAGSFASLLGLVLIIVFMFLAYGLFGAFADIVLIANIFLLLGVLSMLGATLTLPGIAGIVLTMGMAVDANVLVFERIREESRNGRSPINAANAGFKQAFVTIMDSNITTLVASIVLFKFGTGPIRGFAITLGLGIVTSLFTTIMLTRLIVATWLQRKKPKSLPI
ncbi:MAG: protein translocase subunit SecD [Alphaproteobacteria bacterium]|nr:protein translocase subunit SecD [Alphaproteobacteria bacterium]